jgi:hypothetical protein
VAERYQFYTESLPEWGIERITLAQDRDGALYFPVNTICEALAVTRNHYAAFIKADSRTCGGIRDVRAPTAGGLQPMLYIRRRELAIWLTVIDPAKVGPRARAAGRLADFQAALWHLAERIAFKSKASTDASAIPAPIVTTMEGTQYTVTRCPDCGARLRAEVHEGKLSLWHARDGAGVN